MSKARDFVSPLPTACSTEVAQFLRRRPGYFHSIDPTQLERFVADVFRANYKNADVVHVGKSGDWGVDVVFVEAGGRDWLIQVKRRSERSAVESFSTVQNLAGTLAIHGKLRGIIVSTADHFSRQAIDAALRLRSNAFTVRLYDRGVLNRMLSPLLPKTPWAAALREYCRSTIGKVDALPELKRKIAAVRAETPYQRQHESQ